MVSMWFEETISIAQKIKWREPKKVFSMKTSFKRFFAIFGLTSLFATFASAAAASTTIPGVDNFVGIMVGLAGGKVGLFLIVIVIGFSAYNAWKNANIAALLWGLFASIVLAVLVPYATAILGWAQTLTL